jgi:hypothetical protein
VAGQFHPEFRSRPTRPHPLFRDFVGAAAELADRRDQSSAGRSGRTSRPGRGPARIDEPTPPRPAARIGVQDLVGGHERLAGSFGADDEADEGFTPSVVAGGEPIIRLPGTEHADAGASADDDFAEAGPRQPRPRTPTNGRKPYDLGDGRWGGGHRQDEAGSL